ncbi:MAG: hypothetical protein IJS29_08910 [Selenomonadaceae bacterium]|nr:hypothetical protein [Selenomonadaceae bacterium]
MLSVDDLVNVTMRPRHYFKVDGNSAYIEKRNKTFHVFAKVSSLVNPVCVAVFHSKEEADRYVEGVRIASAM